MSTPITVRLNGPTSTSAYNTTYIINRNTPVAIAGPNTTITDTADTQLQSATVTLTNKLDANDLLFVPTGDGPAGRHRRRSGGNQRGNGDPDPDRDYDPRQLSN